jgi:hypothetical protein
MMVCSRDARFEAKREGLHRHGALCFWFGLGWVCSSELMEPRGDEVSAFGLDSSLYRPAIDYGKT